MYTSPAHRRSEFQHHSPGTSAIRQHVLTAPMLRISHVWTGGQHEPSAFDDSTVHPRRMRPWPVCALPVRRSFVVQVGEVMCSPFVAVTFASNFIGDYLTSLVKALIDVQFSICFYASGSWRTLDTQYCTSDPWIPFFITLLPLTWRMLQCLRRFYDDGKRCCHVVAPAHPCGPHSVGEGTGPGIPNVLAGTNDGLGGPRGMESHEHS